MKRISLSEIEVNDLLDLYQSEVDRAQRRINNLKTIIKKLSKGQTTEKSDEKPAKVKGKRGRKPKVKPAENKVVSETNIIREKGLVTRSNKRERKKKAVEVKAAVEEKVVEVKATPKKGSRAKKAVKVKVVPEKKLKPIKAKKAPKKRGRKPKSLRKPIKGGKGENKVKWNDFIIETITSKDSLMLASSITQAALEKFEIPNSDRDRVRMAISTTLTKMTNMDKVLKTYSQKGIRGAFFGLPTWFDEKAKLNNDYKKKLM
jgi:hypothetical protein